MVLVAGRSGINLKLSTKLIIISIIALAIHTPIAAILAIRLPHHHIAAISQMSDRGLFLIARNGSIHRFFQATGYRTVHLGGDVQGNKAGIAAAAITIGHTHGYGAAGKGIAGGILVGEVLDH